MALRGGGLFVDDWSYVARASFDGLPAGPREWIARPGQALIHTVAYGLLRTPSSLLVVLAAANAVAAVLLERMLRPDLGRRFALATAMLFALLPNRGATWFWPATLPNVIALCFVLALPSLPSPLRKVVLPAAILTYEGCSALGIGLALWLAWRESVSWRRRSFSGAAALLPGLAAIAYSSTFTQKTGHVLPLEGASGIAASHFGVGVWPRPFLWLGLLLVGCIVLSGAVHVAPGFTPGSWDRVVLVGVATLGLGLLPFVAVGFPMATDGMLDRANLFGDVGLAIVLVGVVNRTVHPDWLRAPVIVGLSAIFIVGGLHDFRDVDTARRDGTALLASLGPCLARLDPERPIVVEPLPNRGGWATFVEDYDISGALSLVDPRHRRWEAEMALSESAFELRADEPGVQPLPQPDTRRSAAADCSIGGK